jgi:hypothetical protein
MCVATEGAPTGSPSLNEGEQQSRSKTSSRQCAASESLGCSDCLTRMIRSHIREQSATKVETGQ